MLFDNLSCKGVYFHSNEMKEKQDEASWSSLYYQPDNFRNWTYFAISVFYAFCVHKLVGQQNINQTY